MDYDKLMDIAELDVNAVCFGILCNFPQFCGEERAKEAAELVRALYAERENLRADLARVTAERDAAVRDLKLCAGFGDSLCHFCKTDSEKCSSCIGGTRWQWRGPQEE